MPAVTLAAGTIPTLAELSARGREIASSYYESGMVAGVARERLLVESEWFGRLEVSKAIARMISSSVPFADLCDRRGDTARAARARATLVERGVTAA